jgi:FMNH2-dependent dimethyl sulfone monooxygenase
MSLRVGLFYPNSKSVHTMSPAVTAKVPDLLDYDTHFKLARAAEEARMDYAFMADAWGSMGPKSRDMGYMDPALVTPMLANIVLAATKHLRCITTIHTSLFHPLLVARMGGMLDAMSGGRWGINVVTGSGFGETLDKRLFGNLSSEQRYERAGEMMEILQKVWSSGGEIKHEGKYFDLDGWLVGPHPVQKPLPLIVSAGASDAGREFAGHYGDYIFMPGRTPLEELQKRFNDIKRVAVEHGRPADAVKLQMHVSVVVRESKKEAEDYSNWIAETVDLEGVAEYLNSVRSGISTYDDIYRSLGELQMRQIGSVAGSRKIHGDADQVADHIELLQKKFGCDGIAVTFPTWCPEEVKNFGELVLPRLEAKGIWTAPETRGYGW